MNKTKRHVSSIVQRCLEAGPKPSAPVSRTMLALEPRFMFDAAGVATAVDTASHVLPDDAYQSDAPDDSVQSLVAALADQGPAAAQSASQERTEIVFIDTSVKDWAVLRDGVRDGVEVVLLDPMRDGLAQMEQALAGRNGIDAIHLLSHGSDSQLTLGNLALNGGNVDEHADVLGRIGAALSADGDLLLYGCDVGSGEGAAFISKLAELTGADVAASDDPTGAAGFGGDWMLETTRGEVDTGLAIVSESQQAYRGLLAAGTLTFNTAVETVLGPVVTDQMGVTEDIPGITYEIYAADSGSPGASNGQQFTYWDNLLGPEYAGVQSGILGDDANGDAVLVIRSADGSQFDFRGLSVVNYLGVQSRVTIEGFRDGVSTGSVTLAVDISINYNSTYDASQLTRSVFQNVDEVRITNPDEVIDSDGVTSFGYMNYVALQNLVFGEPVDPNPAPAVDANGAAGGTTGSTTFTEGSPVRIVPNATLTDDDGLSSMTLALSATPDGTNEVMIYSAALNGGASLTSLGLSGSYDSTTRTYTVSGTASATVYQNVLRAMTYSNASDGPNTTARTVTISATDAEGRTGQGTATISIVAVNDAPTATNLTQSRTVNEGGSTVALDDIVVTDLDGSDTVTATLSLSDPGAGSLSTGTYGSATSIYNAGTGVWTVSGSVADVNAALAAVALTPSANNEQNFTIATRIRDAAGTGPADGTISVTVTPVNDAPVLDSSSVLALDSIGEEAGAPVNGVASGTLVSALVGGISDPDSGALLGIAIVGADATQGRWWFTTDGGASWSLLGTPSGSAARLLAADANARLHFEPNPNWAGSLATALTIRAWDRTAGSNGGQANISVVGTGGSTPFSSATDTVSLTVNSVNDAPVATVPGSISITEDTTTVLTGISFSDVDAGSSNVTVTLSVPAGALGATSGAGVTVGGTASTMTLTGTIANVNAFIAASNVIYTPATNDTGTRVLTVTINDGGNTGTGGAQSDSQTVNLNISAVNDAPVLTPGATHVLTTTDENTVSSATTVSALLAGTGYGDVDSGALSGIAITASTGNGSWQYSTDGTSWTNVGTVSGSAALLLTSTTQLRYVPDGENGENVSITFRAWDRTAGTASSTGVRATADTVTNGGSSAFSVGTATAILWVTSVNDAPTVANLIAGQSATEGQAFNFAFPSNTFGDVDSGDVLTYSAQLAGGGALPAWLTFNAATRTFSGTPAEGDAGTLSIDVTADDGNGGTVTETFDITVSGVNDAPVATVPTNLSITEDVATALTGISFSDADAGTGSVTVTLSVPAGSLGATSGAGVTVGGTASVMTLSGSIADINAFIAASNVTYTPAANDTGTRVLTVAINDNGNTGGAASSDTETVNLNISAVNDAPVATVPASISIGENATTALTGISFSDADAGSASVTVTLSVPAGSLSASSGGGVTIGGSSSALTLTGSIANINAFIAASNVSYTPALSDNGTRVLTVSIDDGGNTGSGGSQADTETVDLNIASVNDAPVATVPSSISIIEDTATALTGISFADIDATSSSVIVTLSVPVGALSAAAGGGVTVGGSASALTLTGSIADINAFIAASNVIYTPSANDTGARTLTVLINDGGNTGTGGALTDSETVTLNISAVNDAPVASVPSSLSIVEDTATALTGISFSDVDAGSHAAMVALSVPAGALSATSGSGVMVGGSASALTLIGTIADINAFIAASNVTYTPMADDAGSHTLTVAIHDGGNTGSGGARSDSRTVTLNITNVNDAPTGTNLTQIVTYTEDPSAPVTLDAIVATDIDAGDTITATLTLSNAAAGALSTGAFGNATSSYNASTGVWTVTGSVADVNAALAAVAFSPAANWDQNITIATRVRDSAGAGPVDGSITLNVTSVNDAPVAAGAIPAIEGRIDQSLHVVLPAGLFSDADVGDGLTLSVLNLPAGLTFDAATGTISGTPTGEPGEYVVQLVATDITGATSNITFDVRIASLSQPAAPPPWVNMTSGSAIVSTVASGQRTTASSTAPMIVALPNEMPQTSFSAAPAFAPVAIASESGFSMDFSPRPESAPAAPPSSGSSGSLGFLTWSASSRQGVTGIVVQSNPPDVAVQWDASAAGNAKIALPPRTFLAQGASQITIEARMADGRPLPSWVRFDPREGSFTLNPPPGFKGSLDVRVDARTEQGHSASAVFKIVVSGKADDHAAGGETAQSKRSLSEQLRAAGEDGLLAEAAELIERLADAAA